MKYCFMALFFFGCAQPSSGRTTSTNSTGGNTTSVGGMPDMSVDPLADLSINTGNLPDFSGHDLTSAATGDMATVCDPVKQTGCGAGQKCEIGNSATECASNGNVQTAGACGAGTADDCIAGNICLQEDATHLLCRQFCNADADCKQPAVGDSGNVGHCIIGITGSPYKTCTTPCDPVLPTSGCPAGMACIHASTMTIPELTNCEIVGSKGDNVACASINECAVGFTCVSINGGASTCRKVCTKADNSECTGVGAGYTCHKSGTSHWGACF